MNIWKRTEAKKKKKEEKKKVKKHWKGYWSGIANTLHASQSWTSELIPVSVCVCLRVCLTSLLYLSHAHLLSITYFPSPAPFSLLLFFLFFFFFSSLLNANPACVGVDNKLGGEERLEEIREGWFLLNGHVGTPAHTTAGHCDGAVWQPWHGGTGWANNETWYSLLQRSKTSLSASVSGLKVSQPNELFFNYSCKRQTSS